MDAANVQLVSNGKVQLGITHAQMALRGLKGDDRSRTRPPTSRHRAARSAGGGADPGRADGKIQSLDADQEDKMPVRLAFNKRGTMMAVVGEEVFKAAGIAPADIANWGGRIDYVDYNTGLARAQERPDRSRAQHARLSLGAGEAHGARSADMRLIGLDKAVDRQTVGRCRHQADHSSGRHLSLRQQAVNTVTGMVVLVASSKMPDDEAATIVKRHDRPLRLSREGLSAVLAHGPEALTDVAPLTMHPGAAKAYKAAGLLK